MEKNGSVCCKALSTYVLQQFCPWEQPRTYYFNGFLYFPMTLSENLALQ